MFHRVYLRLMCWPFDRFTEMLALHYTFQPTNPINLGISNHRPAFCFDRTVIHDLLDIVLVILSGCFFYRTDGIGLSAPQVGVNVQLMVFNPAGVKGEGEEIVLVNPVVYKSAKRLLVFEEGCLSFPGIYANVVVRIVYVPILLPCGKFLLFSFLSDLSLVLVKKNKKSKVMSHLC